MCEVNIFECYIWMKADLIHSLKSRLVYCNKFHVHSFIHCIFNDGQYYIGDHKDSNSHGYGIRYMRISIERINISVNLILRYNIHLAN